MPGLILRESLAAIKRVRGEARFRRRLRKFSATSQEPPSARAPRNHVMITLGTIPDPRAEPQILQLKFKASGLHPVDFSG
jgi:hypothetical protein